MRVSKLTIIGSDNGLSPDRRQAIIWTNAELLFIGPWGTNFSEILIEILTFSFKKMHLKMSSGKCRPFCFGLNVLSRFLTSLRYWRAVFDMMANNAQNYLIGVGTWISNITLWICAYSVMFIILLLCYIICLGLLGWLWNTLQQLARET